MSSSCDRRSAKRILGVAQLFEISGERSQRSAFVDAVVGAALLDAAMTTDPEFAVDAIGKEFGRASIMFGDEKERTMARARRLQHQNCSRLAATRQEREVAGGAKAEERIVGPDAFVSRRQDQIRSRIRSRKGIAPPCKSCGLRVDLAYERAVNPTARHKIDESLGRHEIVAGFGWIESGF